MQRDQAIPVDALLSTLSGMDTSTPRGLQDLCIILVAGTTRLSPAEVAGLKRKNLEKRAIRQSV
jgi:hypothetical protein